MSQRYCTQCGAELPEQSNFCSQCGAPVENSGPAPVRPAPQPDPYTPVHAVDNGQRPARSRTGLYIAGGIGALLALVAIVYFAFLRPDGLGLARSESDCGDEPCIVDLTATAENAAQNAANLPYPEVARISVDEAHQRLNNGAAIFLDVRDRDSYVAMRIPGAVWIPLDAVGAHRDGLPKDAEILTYCA